MPNVMMVTLKIQVKVDISNVVGIEETATEIEAVTFDDFVYNLDYSITHDKLTVLSTEIVDNEFYTMTVKE